MTPPAWIEPITMSLPVKKRCLLWDWTSTRDKISMEAVNWDGPISSISNWNTWAPPEAKNRTPFRPMIRQMAQLEGNDWAMALNSDQPIIQYLNEPERDGVTPKKAAAAWFKQMVPLRRDKGKRLVGPAVASDHGGDLWLAEFMKLVATELPDILALHYYGPEPKAAIEYIERMHHTYPSLPVIVSEIASISRDEAEVHRFTVELANWMDSQEWICEYAFFGCMQHVADDFVSPQAQLMRPDGTFTALMDKLLNEQPMKV